MSVLGQHDETGRKERAIYEISKKFTDYETRYTVLEKRLCSTMSLATPTPLHVELYDHADCKDGPAEVSL